MLKQSCPPFKETYLQIVRNSRDSLIGDVPDCDGGAYTIKHNQHQFAAVVSVKSFMAGHLHPAEARMIDLSQRNHFAVGGGTTCASLASFQILLNSSSLYTFARSR